MTNNKSKKGVVVKPIGMLVCIFCAVFASQLCLAGQQLTVCGTGDSQQLLRALGEAFSETHPDTVIEVPDSIGSSGGIRATADGKCDIGRTARPLKKKEMGYGLNYRLFASTPVVFVTNKSVAVHDISTPQVIALYKGEIGNWQQLGGKDAVLYLAVRYHGDSARSVLEKHMPPLAEFIDWAGEITYSTPETVEAVVRHDHTIAFLPLAMAVKNNLNIFRLNGIEPSAENIRNATYPLIIPLGLVWKGELQGASEDFVNFIFSHRGKKVIADNGAVPSN
jgi:phosphate transport system substrate-binding protein